MGGELGFGGALEALELGLLLCWEAGRGGLVLEEGACLALLVSLTGDGGRGRGSR